MCGPLPCDSPDCTWGERHRRQCEARHVMRLAQDKRREYYAAVAKKRGQPAFVELKAEVTAQWRKENTDC